MRQISISQRAINTPFSPIRKLHQYAEIAKHKGYQVYHLNIGQPDFPMPRKFCRAVKKYLVDSLEYAPSAGYGEAVQAWQKYYQNNNIHFKKNEIIVTTGGSEAIIFALLAVADFKEEVLVFEPLYTNYITFAKMAGIKLKPVVLDPKKNYHLPSRREIINHISDRTKAIIICNPSNPTGTVFSQRELQLIVDIAQQYKLFIIADETYREIVFNGKKFVSMMDFKQIRDRVVLVDSVSKRFNLCGARIGCLASKNNEIVASALKFAQGRLSSPTLEQLAVIPLLESAKRYTIKLKKEYEKRRDIVLKTLCKYPGVTCGYPDGAFYTMVTLPLNNAEHFSQWLLEKFSYKGETVMLAPGNGFYVTPGMGQQEVRLAYVLNCRKLKKAMRILEVALETYKRKFK